MKWMLAFVLFPVLASASEECVAQLGGKCRAACEPNEEREQGAFIDCTETDECCVPARKRSGPSPSSTSTRASEPSAAAAGGACERLVRTSLSRMERSPLVEFQAAVQAHGIAKLMVDALGKQLPAGTWREGEPHWEEAYALLQPELLAHMRSAGAQELRYQEANLPRHLDAATCEKHLALLESKLGSVAQGVQDAADTKQFLASFEKVMPTPPRLEQLARKLRRWIDDGAALAKDPEVRRQKARFEKAREELRTYGKQLLAGLKKMGEGRGPEQEKASRDAGEQMVQRHKARLVDILRRFRQANGG